MDFLVPCICTEVIKNYMNQMFVNYVEKKVFRYNYKV